METQTPVDEQAADQVKQPQTPFEFLALFPGSPTPDQIEAYRKMVPGGRLRLLPMTDGKRLFLLRGFTALELQGVQAEVTKIPAEKQDYAVQCMISVRCTLWTSMTTTGRLTDGDLAAAGAGLAPTLNYAITDLSDYNTPQILEQLYIDL
jgi:hypothetical protein